MPIFTFKYKNIALRYNNSNCSYPICRLSIMFDTYMLLRGYIICKHMRMSQVIEFSIGVFDKRYGDFLVYDVVH
jgi:hypothetical protein